MQDQITSACNGLTRRWTKVLDPEKNSVFSGPGAWLVLAAVLAGAEGGARQELETALTISKNHAATGLKRLMAAIAASHGTHAASGLWFRSDIAINDVYAAAIEPIMVSPLPADFGELDDWVRTNTDGQIEQFPPINRPYPAITLASVLSAHADWTEPFEGCVEHWRDQTTPSNWLQRAAKEVDNAALLESETTTVSRVICETVKGFDVHLLAGSAHDLADVVLAAGLDALSGEISIRTGSKLQLGDHGGCLTVRRMPITEPLRPLHISVPVFDLNATHDLTKQHELFGLTTALNTTGTHFPDISNDQLFIETALQTASARFSAKGFRAAALTVVSTKLGGMPRRIDATVIDVKFDRPFGFLVVDRSTGIVSFAGWVADVRPQRTLDDMSPEEQEDFYRRYPEWRPPGSAQTQPSTAKVHSSMQDDRMVGDV